MTGNRSPGRLRLLVLSSTFPRWQDDHEPPFVFELCRRLAQSAEVVALVPHAPGAAERERLAGVDVIRYRYAPEVWERLAYEGGILSALRRNPFCLLLVPFLLVAQWWALMRLLRSTRFDAAHAHWLIPQGAIAVLGLWLSRCRTPLVCTAHGSDVFALGGTAFAAVRRKVARSSAQVTVVSHALRERLIAEGGDAAKIHVVPMGVDLVQRFVPDPLAERSPLEILGVGRLVAGKRFDTLIRALPAILEAHPGASVTLVGTGPERAALSELCARLGVADRVAFAGSLANARLPELFRRAALTVLPSAQEGLGLVLAEAMGCECPVVASDIPAVCDVVKDGETGLLFPVGDHAALAAQVARMFADADMRARLGRAGRERVLAELDWSIVTARYRDILEEVA